MKSTLPFPHGPARWLGRGIFVALTLLAGLTRDLPAQSPQVSGSKEVEGFSASELEALLGPIALYPDALIALILPAATVPTDVTLAARFLEAGQNSDQLESQSWDDSVKSLTRYPDLIQWMDENLEWTASSGDAFIAQPTEVMNTMQILRQKALAAGHLTSTPQQTVVEETVEDTTYLRIVPAEPNFIYIPAYDPQIVYYATPSYFVGNVISFGVGFSLGVWLNYDCDWGRRKIYCGSYRAGWNNNWNHRNRSGGGQGVRNHEVANSANINAVNISSQSARVWNPSTRSRQQTERRGTNRPSQRELATTATRSRFSSTPTRTSKLESPTFPQNSRSSGNGTRPLRVDPPPNLNQSARNSSLSSRRNGQISSQTINSPVPDSNPNPNAAIDTYLARAQAPTRTRGDVIVPTNVTSPSTSLERNRRGRPTASNPSPRSQPTATIPVGFDHSRFRTVQPALTPTHSSRTVNSPRVNPSSSSRFQPQPSGGSRIQTSGANVPATAGWSGRNFSPTQPSFQGASQNQRFSGGMRNR